MLPVHGVATSQLVSQLILKVSAPMSEATGATLYGYFRSTAAYRVRIALGLKGLSAEHKFVHLRKGEQSGRTI